MLRDQIDALATRLRPHYRRFLEPLGARILLTAHSHQAWPDVSRAAHIAAWDDAARLIDRKWTRILGEVLPAFQARVAARLGSSRPTDLTVAPNTHELVYRLASGFRPDATVVTTDAEFHSLRRQLTRLSEDGLNLIAVATDGPEFGARFLRAVDAQRPDWTALSQVLFTNARVITELPHILAGLAEREIPVLVDAYHAFNVLTMNVDEWPGTVFVTGGGYKYAQSGEGACWLLLPPNAERFRPRHTGWFADFDGLETSDGRISYGPGGWRFFGSTFDASGIYRGAAVLEWMDEQGLDPETLRQAASARTQLIIDGFDRHELSARGLRLATPRDPAQRGGFVAIESAHAAAIADDLASAGILIDRREQRLRFGPAPYTTTHEIDRALAILSEIAERYAA